MNRTHPDILVAGPSPAVQRRMVFDSLRPGSVNRAAAVEVFASGKGVNAARAATRLGGRVEALLVLGGDTGDWMRKRLLEEGIAVAAAAAPDATRTCVTLLDEANGTATELVENAGPASGDTFAEYWGLFEHRVARAAVLLCIGTLPAAFPEDTYARMVARARECGARTVVDAQGEVLRLACAAGCDVAKPNRRELAQALGRALPPDDACRELLAWGAGAAVVSDESGPVTVRDASGCRAVRPPVVRAANPIGSGDTMAGVLALELARGQDLDTALVRAVAAASSNAAGMGYGRVDPDDCRRMAALVTRA